MIRLIGAAIIIASTAAIGLGGVWRLRDHVRSLASILTSLDLMESEICSRLAPMREVLEQLSRDAPEPARAFFQNASGGMELLGVRSFYRIWDDAVRGTGSLALTEEERQTLAELGLSLGRYDVREQSESIDRVRRRMEAYLREAERQRDRDSRLHAFFGVASGLVAVILLL